jgi:16S rRNA (guanine527-N7)-methyltransferase
VAAADPLRDVLIEALTELQLRLELAEPLVELSRLVAAWAGRMNLTAHRTPADVARRLVLDALALAQACPAPEPTSVADLGSGAGFPGLPMAILWPRCRVTLIEARERRHHFQRAAIRAVGLANATALRGRAEELAPVGHEVVVSQAMAAPARALAWMAPWAADAGWLLLPQAEAGPPIEPPPGIEPAGVLAYRVPLGGAARSLWIGRRTGARG